MSGGRLVKAVATVLLAAALPSGSGERNLAVAPLAGPGVERTLALVDTAGATWVDLEALARELQLPTRIDRSGAMVWESGLHRIRFTPGSAFVSVDGTEMRQLPLPVRGSGNRTLALFEPLLDLISEYYPGELLYEPTEPRLLVARGRYDLYGIRYQTSPGLTRAVLAAAREVECRADSLPDGSVRLFFPGSTIDTSGFALMPPEGLVADAQVQTSRVGVEVRFKPEPGAHFSEFLIQSDPPLCAVEFRGPADYAAPAEASEQLDRDRRRWALDVVVLDPGHGGKDPGAIGRGKLREKDVTLDVALRLRKLLEHKGIRTVMTRESDVFVELSRRTQIANRSGGKLFVSLHCNAARDSRAGGIETYFLAPAKSERAMQVAMMENSVVRYEAQADQYQELTEENYILLAMAQANFARESQELAGVLQSRVPQRLGLKDRGVDQAGFYVLVGASMPAVLFEMGFITNPDEERRFRDRDYRQRLAEEIAAAVVNFLERSGRP